MEISSRKAAVGASGSLTVTEMDRRSNRGGGCDCGRPIDSYGKHLAAKGLKPGPSASGVYEHQTATVENGQRFGSTASASAFSSASAVALLTPSPETAIW